jgi:hypothetical protein
MIVEREEGDDVIITRTCSIGWWSMGCFSYSRLSHHIHTYPNGKRINNEIWPSTHFYIQFFCIRKREGFLTTRNLSMGWWALALAVVFLIRNAKGEVVWVFVSLVVTHETFLVSRMTEYCCPAMAPALYSMCNAYGKRDLMAYDVGINSNSGFFPKPNERKY